MSKCNLCQISVLTAETDLCIDQLFCCEVVEHDIIYSSSDVDLVNDLGAVWLRWPAQMARGTKGHLVAANRPCMKWPLLQPNGTSPSSGEAPCTCISQLHFSIVLAPESSVRPRHPSRPSFQPLGTPQNHHPP